MSHLEGGDTVRYSEEGMRVLRRNKPNREGVITSVKPINKMGTICHYVRWGDAKTATSIAASYIEKVEND